MNLMIDNQPNKTRKTAGELCQTQSFQAYIEMKLPVVFSGRNKRYMKGLNLFYTCFKKKYDRLKRNSIFAFRFEKHS
jgi:hypothetical protein